MKKRLIALFLVASAMIGSVFAKGLPSVRSSEGLFIYRIVINTDINRDFYSKSLDLVNFVNEPHTSGSAFTKKISGNTPQFKYQYYVSNQPTGEFTGSIFNKKEALGSSFSPYLYVFGQRFKIEMPTSKDGEGKLSFDKSESYFYIGTFVYDFIDGLPYPVLREVRDEFDDAAAWLESFGNKKAVLYRAEIQ